MVKNRKVLNTVVVVVLAICMLAGCSKAVEHEMIEVGAAVAPESMNGLDMMADKMTAEEYQVSDSTATTASPAMPDNRKLVQTVRMTVETERLDEFITQLDAKIASLAGYVENQSIQNGSAYSGKRYRYGEMTVRIPAENLKDFLNQVSGAANVVYSEKSVDDITLTYVATESRITALKTEEARLLELLAKAENMSDLLAIEQRLTDVYTELEQVTSYLKVYDNQVDYATVRLSISEVTEYTVVEEAPATMGQRIASGFRTTLRDIGEGFEDLLVFFVINLPYFLILGVVITGAVFVIRYRKKKKAAKKTDTSSQA